MFICQPACSTFCSWARMYKKNFLLYWNHLPVCFGTHGAVEFSARDVFHVLSPFMYSSCKQMVGSSDWAAACWDDGFSRLAWLCQLGPALASGALCWFCPLSWGNSFNLSISLSISALTVIHPTFLVPGALNRCKQQRQNSRGARGPPLFCLMEILAAAQRYRENKSGEETEQSPNTKHRGENRG